MDRRAFLGSLGALAASAALPAVAVPDLIGQMVTLIAKCPPVPNIFFVSVLSMRGEERYVMTASVPLPRYVYTTFDLESETLGLRGGNGDLDDEGRPIYWDVPCVVSRIGT